MLSIWSCYGGSAVRYKVRRKLLSQNFLYSRTLINSLVRRSSIGQNDTVLEIGPGKGFITAELLKVAKKVIAVELNKNLVLHLKKFLGHYLNLQLHQIDFLKFSLPNFSYKVFANVPFSKEGEIIRKLLDTKNPPEDCYLIVDKRLALRLSGISHENQFSLKHKPFFDFSIYHYFKRSDFIPMPNVDSVMWRINKREKPSIPWNERENWERFIEIGFGQGQSVKQNLRKILSKEQIDRLSQKINFSLKSKPSYLSLEQWLKLYMVVTHPMCMDVYG